MSTVLAPRRVIKLKSGRRCSCGRPLPNQYGKAACLECRSAAALVDALERILDLGDVRAVALAAEQLQGIVDDAPFLFRPRGEARAVRQVRDPIIGGGDDDDFELDPFGPNGAFNRRAEFEAYMAAEL